jgi:DNA-binding CsgD family transcriptional regulator
MEVVDLPTVCPAVHAGMGRPYEGATVVDADLVQSFLERCERNESLEALTAAFREALESLGFRYFACCSHVDPFAPPPGSVMFHNYPGAWVKAFSESKLYEIDPVLRYAERTLVPFTWDSPQFRSQLLPVQREILGAGASLGIVHGFTIPIHVPWEPDSPTASCSLIPDSTLLKMRNYFTVQLLVAPFYEAARKASVRRGAGMPVRLSPRERECLEFLAQGLTDWESSRILKISESTVRTHIKRALQRLGTEDRHQGIARALALRVIRFGDILPSTASDRQTSDHLG